MAALRNTKLKRVLMVVLYAAVYFVELVIHIVSAFISDRGEMKNPKRVDLLLGTTSLTFVFSTIAWCILIQNTTGLSGKENLERVFSFVSHNQIDEEEEEAETYKDDK